MSNKVMVCVTRQKNCERLVNKGKHIAAQNNDELIVIHVAKTGEKLMGDTHEGAALDYLFQCSKKANAEMHILRSDDVVSAIVKFAKEQSVSLLLLGSAPESNADGGLGRLVQKQLPGIEVKII